MNPTQGSRWFERLYRAAIDVPGPQVATLTGRPADLGPPPFPGPRPAPSFEHD